MARRKGSGRGRPALNARKSAVDPIGDKKNNSSAALEQQNQEDLSNMKAAATAKHYNKTKLQNNHRSVERKSTNATSSNTNNTTTYNKKHNSNNNTKNNNANLQIYNSAIGETHGGGGSKVADNIKSSKLTKSTKNLPATSTTTSDKDSFDQLAISNVKDAKLENKRNIHEEQKTGTNETNTSSSRNNNLNNINNNNSSSSSNNNNNNNNSNSDNSLSKNNSNLSVSDITSNKQYNKSNTNNSMLQTTNQNNSETTIVGAASSSATSSSSSSPKVTVISWNNSKYLHKKFKRLASTTEVDGIIADEQNAGLIDCVNGKADDKLRSTSSSSSVSSASSPPPQSLPLQNANVEVQKNIENTIPNGIIGSVRKEPLVNAEAKFVKQSANINFKTDVQQEQLQQHQQEYKTNVTNQNSNPLPMATVDNITTYNSLNHSNANIVPRTLSNSNVNNHNVSHTNVSPVEMEWSNSSTVSVAEQSNSTGRYVCQYCNLNCTKPSVLQKHIRAHTNERPYPCEICGIAFKTKSNYYKHCRSRTHAARKRGIEIPVDVDDSTFAGGSDQEIDAELSNSSSDVLSRTASPIDERSTSSPSLLNPHQQNHQNYHLHQMEDNISQRNVVTSIPTPSPSSISSSKSAYLQQPIQIQPTQSLPLGSPAAGTLPPLTVTLTGNTAMISSSGQKNSFDYKPYKPKFHNASLYASSKDGVNQQHQQQQNQHQLVEQPKVVDNTLKITQNTQIHQQQLQQQQTQQHHPSLSPSTQIKLNNHINSHQMQLHLQQQQQQHAVLPISSNAAAIYFLGQQQPPPPPTGSLSQQYFNAAAVVHQQALAQFHMLTPQQQQQYHHQLQIQQQFHPATSLLKASTSTAHQRINHQTIASIPITPAPVVPISLPPHQNPLHYIANTTANTNLPATNNTNNNNNNSSNSSGTSTQTLSTTPTTSLLHSNKSSVTTATSTGLMPLDKEFLQEHISKLISQNEAIVENKELLLQKKYPKTLNRSRSFNNTNNGGSSSNTLHNSNYSTGTNGLVNTTAVASESTNAKIAQAIVQKQQQQLQHQLQQQQLQQQQHHQQTQFHQVPHQTLAHPVNQLRAEEVVHSSGGPLNGISKHITNTKPPSALNILPQQQQQQQHQQQPQPQPLQNPQYRTAHHVPQSLQSQAQHMLKEVISISSGNIPLNLSAKPKINEEVPSSSPSLGANSSTTSQGTNNFAPRKRQSIEHQVSTLSCETSSSSSSGSSSYKNPPNNSIIKNLLLNARGLAVPTGEGEDAVYVCPLCSLEFRTAEDLQLHNSSYCQGASSSAPISPVASPSYKYFRSNSISLNIPELKDSFRRELSKNPLSLVKLAWSQLKTKPSSLVLSRLSASQAGTSKVTTSSTSASALPVTLNTNCNSASTSAAAASTASESSLILVDAPLPSPGPLLGKTPLVDSYNNSNEDRKSKDVIITKMHEDRQFSNLSAEHLANKRPKYEVGLCENLSISPSKRVSSIKSVTGETSIHNLTGSNDLSFYNKKEERLKRFTSSGGSMIPISECHEYEKSPKMIRTPLLSGGSFQEVSPKIKDNDSKNMLSLNPPLSKLNSSGVNLSNGPQHFQFPPINSITAFNPLTLPIQSSMEKIIPYVPGIPGPNNLMTPQLPPSQNLQIPNQHLAPTSRTLSPNHKKSSSPMPTVNDAANKLLIPPITQSVDLKPLSPFGGVQNVPSEFSRIPPSPVLRNVRNWPVLPQGTSQTQQTKQTTLNTIEAPKKSFNFLRMADNVSPRKNVVSAASTAVTIPKITEHIEKEVRHFNFDNISKENTDIIPNSQAGRVNLTSTLAPLHVDTSVQNLTTNPATQSISESDAKKSKFLRPTSLPLKPGTFTPKKHHGITPNANTLPLISPETPRPSKAFVQLYLNGHAYTYLGLKSSTKTFYCTVNCPQPSYVAGMHKLSMYSVWQVCAENNPHPLGFKPKVVMSLYDSRHKTISNTMAGANKLEYSLVVSQQTVMTPFVASNPAQYYHHQIKQLSIAGTSSSEQLKIESDDLPAIKKESNIINSVGGTSSSASNQMLVGGYESHEDYTYIRGRGRGRYVCSECGIRCKKPSMLKKHIRTHTDVRPYTCKHCNFSFKTKGNLTKHMQSKTHFKKCIELGIHPGPMPADSEFSEPDVEFDQQSSTSAGGRTSSIPGESDTDDSTDNETESSDTDESKSRLQEHEAARCLLSLSMTPPITQSVSPQLKSEHYNFQQHNNTETIASTFVNNATDPPLAQLTNIKRVESFTLPKPPFDYQKQEKYYSNPEESKPKNTTTSANFESAPIDLTKPRVAESTTSIGASTQMVYKPTVSSYEIRELVAAMPGPLQTQAQIRDVIFGNSNNESGFLKSLIFASDKVRTSAEVTEDSKKINENILLQAYITEQALQRTKIKQSQMNRSFPDQLNMGTANQNCTNTITVVSNSGSNKPVLSPSNSSQADSLWTTNINENNVKPNSVMPIVNLEPLPNNKVKDILADNTGSERLVTAKEVELHKKDSKEKIIESTESNKNNINNKINKVSEETEEVEFAIDPVESLSKLKPPSNNQMNQISTSKTINTPITEPQIHNSNLPAAVQQPGTTDFSGVLSAPTRTVIVGEDVFQKSANNEIQPRAYPRVPISTDGRPVCTICSKTFQKQSQLSLHMNIHYIERKFKCEPCGFSFRMQGHLQKHERSEAHKNKVMMISTFGVPTSSNPRPFECTDCKIAFRIHGHLAKHLRSKTHVQKLECLQKLPFGTYAEIERAGISLTEIDTSDCDNSLISLKLLAQKLIEKDPTKLNNYTTPSGIPNSDANSNTGIGSQDSASEDGFSAAASAAASAIASLDNDSAASTPQRTNSMSEDETIATSLNNNLKRRLPGSFSNGEESDNPLENEKRICLETRSAVSSPAPNYAATNTNN